MKKFIPILLFAILCFGLFGAADECGNSTTNDQKRTMDVGNRLASNQPTPTDVRYSLERYNLIRRTYWINGEPNKAQAASIRPAIQIPLSYVYLYTGAQYIGRFVVDGKVTSMNSYLTPDSEYYERNGGGSTSYNNNWLPDVDGAYGTNENGIFFFTASGIYMEFGGPGYTYFYVGALLDVGEPEKLTPWIGIVVEGGFQWPEGQLR